ncbi:hypothetical protein PRECH8_04790 [Insulibacter thermoxylanivorax]|uniref:Uncharacterized protein n=1 Tax=Insulibacter thermoxylanivorax TaxID=2749268 RepID=A0A916QD57_9BACL|nr:hypothetical protein [Insulibacter thermoxylanivorax]GFR37183.1 hypothetical protein PRECH8_04790 [Insulibacter thermoxylanivorax]
MSFKLLKEAEQYYETVERRRDDGAKFRTKFDFYYLCLMAGLHFRQMGTLEQEKELNETAYFIDYYPEPFPDKVDLIVGLLIDAEMERKHILPSDKKEVEKLMLDLIDHQSYTKLSSKGHKLLNLYAAGGFNRIKETILPTTELEVFLLHYMDLMNEPA